MGNDKMTHKYWIWLQSVLGYSSTGFAKVIEQYKTAENVYNIGRDELANSGLFSKKQLSNIKKTDLSVAENVIKDCNYNNIKIIAFDDEMYPDCLRNIPSPPVVLYILGDLPDFDSLPAVCVVGPRKPSDYAVRAAFSLSYRLAKGGILVVSGGALGVDTCAHSGALAAGCKTVAVLGCGILDKYLAQNSKLRRTISENGCLISEFQPRYEATRYSFPMRNRIMSGISAGTVVVEAKLKSGSLITANCALEQNRDVFVIPGSPGNPNCEGSNLLIKDGAIPLLDTKDIFDEYCDKFSDKIDVSKAFGEEVDKHLLASYKSFAASFLKNANVIKTAKENSAVASGMNVKNTEHVKSENNEHAENSIPDLSLLSSTQRQVLSAMPDNAFVPDTLNINGISYSDLYLALTQLEIEGIIESVPGGMYRKTI